MEAADRPHFGALLRQFRLDAGMTQQELAERAKLSVEAISTLERGARARPYRETVVLLGRALDLSPERQTLLSGAIGVGHAPRRRSEALDASLLRLVHPDSPATPRHNLPQQLTSLVGRQREVGEIAKLLREHRLVTIVGAGGVGKTRVAVQTGSDVLDDSPDGVWLIDLAPIADQTLVVSSVLSALHLASTTGSPLDAVVAYIKTRRLVLILDSCEHVIAHAREVAARIVHSCPNVRILSTSREELDIPGERVYRLPSLAVPSDLRASAQNVLSHDAVTLFVDRALAVSPGFALTDDNAQDVAQICRRLDGIPLAIELAAARVKVLAPRQIAERLVQRFRLLTGGDPRALPRHRTMTALIDWSYDLLTPREQRFFESLSIFAGGSTLEATTAVCATDEEDDIAVIELVASLATKSLLVGELVGSEQRYFLLESVRQYARDKLMGRGEQPRLARRHALFYVELAERLDHAWETTPDREWLPLATVELENWRAALEWTLAKRGDAILGQQLAAAWNVMRGAFPQVERRQWVHTALELVGGPIPPDLVARLELADAQDASRFGEWTACLGAAERALVRYRELANVPGIAYAKELMGSALVYIGRHTEGEPLLREALEAARMLGNRRLTAVVLQDIRLVQTLVGDFVAARASLTEALGLAKLAGADDHAASITSCLADNAYDAGDAETALRLMLDALAQYRALIFSSRPGMTQTLAMISMYLLALGRYDEARAHATEALEAARDLRLGPVLALSLQYLALVALLRPQVGGRSAFMNHACVARLFGFVDARVTALGISEMFNKYHRHEHARAALGEALGVDELTRQMAIGAAMTEDEAIEAAHKLE